MATPALDVVTYLNTNVAALTTGTNLFKGPVRPADNFVPQEAVFVLQTGGEVPSPFLGGGTEDNKKPDVQIRVRTTKTEFDNGQTLAQSVYDAINYATISGWTDIRTQQALPLYLGENDNTDHEWSINIKLWIRE